MLSWLWCVTVLLKAGLLLQTISSLEKDIAGLKKEIGERDETIGDKEKRIYDLKKKNQASLTFTFFVKYPSLCVPSTSSHVD